MFRTTHALNAFDLKFLVIDDNKAVFSYQVYTEASKPGKSFSVTVTRLPKGSQSCPYLAIVRYIEISKQLDLVNNYL